MGTTPKTHGKDTVDGDEEGIGINDTMRTTPRTPGKDIEDWDEEGVGINGTKGMTPVTGRHKGKDIWDEDCICVTNTAEKTRSIRGQNRRYWETVLWHTP